MTKAEWEITHARPIPVPKHLSIHLGWTQPCTHSGEVRGLRHTVRASHISTATVPACKPSPNHLLRLHLLFLSLIPEPIICFTHCLLVQPSVVSGGGRLRVLFSCLAPSDVSCAVACPEHCSAASSCFLGIFRSEAARGALQNVPLLVFHCELTIIYLQLAIIMVGFYLILHHHKVVNTRRDLSWSSRQMMIPPHPDFVQRRVS